MLAYMYRCIHNRIQEIEYKKYCINGILIKKYWYSNYVYVHTYASLCTHMIYTPLKKHWVVAMYIYTIHEYWIFIRNTE